jgi:hypothetical protein
MHDKTSPEHLISLNDIKNVRRGKKLCKKWKKWVKIGKK